MIGFHPVIVCNYFLIEKRFDKFDRFVHFVVIVNVFVLEVFQKMSRIYTQ